MGGGIIFWKRIRVGARAHASLGTFLGVAHDTGNGARGTHHVKVGAIDLGIRLPPTGLSAGGLAHRSRIWLPSMYVSVLQRTKPRIVSQAEYSMKSVKLGKHAKMILCYV